MIPPKPRLRQLANKQSLVLADDQKQVSRFIESTSQNLNRVDGQHVARRQLDTATTTTTINTTGSRKSEPDGQTLDYSQGNQDSSEQQDSSEKRKEQFQHRPAIKVKPRVVAKSSNVADSDCIPRASVRLLISRFS